MTGLAVEAAGGFDLGLEQRAEGSGQDRHAILVALAAAHEDLVAAEVDVLDAQATAFEQAQAGSVQERRHQASCARQLVQDRSDFVAGEDDGESLLAVGVDEVVEPGQVDGEDASVEEQESGERLVLGRRGDAVSGRELAEEASDLVAAEAGGVAPTAERVVAAHPAEVGLLCPWAETPERHGFASANGERDDVVSGHGYRLAGSRAGSEPPGERASPVLGSLAIRFSCGGASILLRESSDPGAR